MIRGTSVTDSEISTDVGGGVTISVGTGVGVSAVYVGSGEAEGGQLEV